MTTPVMDQWVLDVFGLDVGARKASPHPATPAIQHAEIERDYRAVNWRLHALMSMRQEHGETSDPIDWAHAYSKAMRMSAAAGAKDWPLVSKLLPSFRQLVDHLEQLTAKHHPSTPAGSVTLNAIQRMTDAELQRLGPVQLAAMVRTLSQSGPLVGAARKAEYRLYQAMKLDPAFVKESDAKGEQVASDLAGNKQLISARDNWTNLSDDERLSALRVVLKAQCKRLNLSMPEIYKVSTAGGAEAYTRLDGAITLNLDPATTFRKSLAQAMDTITHENAHRHALELVVRLRTGQLKPGTAEFAQATMFAANIAGGEIDPAEDMTAYRTQPMEAFAFHAGPALSHKVMAALAHPK